MTFENVVISKPQLDTFMSNGPKDVMLQITVCHGRITTKISEIHEESTVVPLKLLFLTEKIKQ